MIDAKALARQTRFANGGRMIKAIERRHPTRVIDSHELILVDRGTLPIFEQERDHRVGPGEFVLLRAGRRHGGSADYPPGLRFRWLHFHHRGALPALPDHGAWARPDIAIDLAARLLDEQDRDDAPAGSCDLLMTLLLLECTAARPADGDDPSGLAERARQHIVAHHREPIGPGEVAAGCGCSTDHLGRLFRARFGRSLGAALHDERIASAKALLRDGGRSVGEVATACGFADPGYFRRVFKRATGTSPGAWARVHLRSRVNAR